MSQSNVVSIGGIDYDSTTGLALTSSHASVKPDLRRNQSVHAKGVHTAQQRSSALNRRFVKKTASASDQPVVNRPSGRTIDVRPVRKRSPHISKFARDPEVIRAKRVHGDIGPVHHPVVAKAHVVTAKRSSVVHATPAARDIKHAAIGHALANAAPSHSATKSPKRGRGWNVAGAMIGLLLLTGYFTYINLPNLSVRVAAAQAGIDATYPEYRPVGYRLNGPVAYKNGEVSMNFASNSGPVSFSLNQSKSSWDSSALLEKYVNPKSDGKYATYSDDGLTIYTYGTDAAWVNGGILYTVDGSAMLSNEQIRRMATSM
jgi:hypothetical protein